jgi:hypothetical protein
VAIDVRVFDDQVAAGRHERGVKAQLFKDVVASVVRIKDNPVYYWRASELHIPYPTKDSCVEVA